MYRFSTNIEGIPSPLVVDISDITQQNTAIKNHIFLRCLYNANYRHFISHQSKRLSIVMKLFQTLIKPAWKTLKETKHHMTANRTALERP